MDRNRDKSVGGIMFFQYFLFKIIVDIKKQIKKELSPKNP